MRLLDNLDPFDLFDTEASRLDRFFRTVDGAASLRPARCDGWTVRDVLAHLAGTETYYQACLDGRLARFLIRLRRAGVDLGSQVFQGPSLTHFSEWSVEQRRGVALTDVLSEWRATNENTRRRLRSLGRNRLIQTGSGAALAGEYAFYCAAEYATRADDIGAPVGVSEEAERARWRARVGILALSREAVIRRKLVFGSRTRFAVDELSHGYRVQLGELETELSTTDFVAATVGRPPIDHPLEQRLRVALACLPP